MKRVLAGVLLGVCLVVTGCAVSRPPETQPYSDRDLGYRLEAGDVVFEFDPAKYTNVTRDTDGEWLAMGNVSTSSVAVAGDFNQWSRTAWSMSEVREGVYELRRERSLFDGRRDWSFKFVVNGSYWVEPPVDARNRVPSGAWAMNRSYDLVLRVPILAAASGSKPGEVTLQALSQSTAATGTVCVLEPVPEWSEDNPFPIESNPFISTDRQMIRLICAGLLPPTGSEQEMRSYQEETFEREVRLIEAIYLAVYESCRVYGLQSREALPRELRTRFEANAFPTIIEGRLAVFFAPAPGDSACYRALRAEIQQVLSE